MENSTITIGHRFSRRHVFDEAQASAFASAAGDANPVHHDAEYASRTRFGGLIVSGTHTMALMMGLAASHFSRDSMALGVNFSVELLRPVFAHESVLMEWTVTALSVHHRGGRLVEITGAMTGEDGQVRIRTAGCILLEPGKPVAS